MLQDVSNPFFSEVALHARDAAESAGLTTAALPQFDLTTVDQASLAIGQGAFSLLGERTAGRTEPPTTLLMEGYIEPLRVGADLVSEPLAGEHSVTQVLRDLGLDRAPAGW
ncbi:hypothetical protein [Georgenia yuyongxinii]